MEGKAAKRAPDFKLEDQNGEKHRLINYWSRWVVLYFYPKDNTPGCTQEACSFRDYGEEFTRKGVVILGVSGDSIKSHQKFAETYRLNFPILADENKVVAKKYKVLKENGGIKRTTFLINPESQIEKVYENVNPDGHALQILADISDKELNLV